jgi:predicted anti-sigma-YlaC factor YlaD
MKKTCEQIRDRIQEQLDSAPLEAGHGILNIAPVATIEDHVNSCVACREFQRELESIRTALREMPQLNLPEEDLEAVWERTVRARVSTSHVHRISGRTFSWMALAAAVLFATIALQLVPQAIAPPAIPTAGVQATDTPAAADVELASQQLRWALGMTGEAIRKSRRAAAKDLVAVDATLNQLPIRLPLTRGGLTGKRGEL